MTNTKFTEFYDSTNRCHYLRLSNGEHTSQKVLTDYDLNSLEVLSRKGLNPRSPLYLRYLQKRREYFYLHFITQLCNKWEKLTGEKLYPVINKGESVSLQMIPKQVKREDILKMLNILGIDYKNVGVLEIEVQAIGVYVTLEAQNDEGKCYLDNDYNVAMHRIFIPIVD